MRVKMLALNTKNASLWAQRMCSMSLSADEMNVTSWQKMLSSARRLSSFGEACKEKIVAMEDERAQAHTSSTNPAEGEGLPFRRRRLQYVSMYSNGISQDLRRFLEEVGTDPKEARFWLKHFKQSSEPFRPFAIVQVDDSIFKKTQAIPFNLSAVVKKRADEKATSEASDELDQLASTLSFLHRNNMKVVVVHGEQVSAEQALDPEKLKEIRSQTCYRSMLLASILEMHGAPARPLFAGSSIIQATPADSFPVGGKITSVNLDPVYWAIQSDHIPIIQSVGESFCGQMLVLDVFQSTAQLARSLQPRKVLFISTSGGITNENNEVIPNINLPVDQSLLSQEWCNDEVREQISFVSDLLYSLPQQSSIVITAASKLLTELFTHHGSGTFFKIIDPIQRLDSLKGVDLHRLTTLFNKSFGRELRENYIEQLGDRLHSIYLCENYSAAAVITKLPGTDIPYLDKFAVSVTKQSEGTADVLWGMIKRDFEKLYWRSRVTNPINPWYFSRSEGSWSNGQWIVFWYGGVTHTNSSRLVNTALGLPNSFKT